ncbi:MAG TPA: hypothetical protein DEW74_02065 [Opitutae bacterium]|nr:hypothetical protein [Opitutae bacterium]
MKRFLWVSLVLLLPAAWGRSPFLSAFKPYLKTHIDLSESLLALSYSVAGFLSAIIVPYFISSLGKNFKLTHGFRVAYGIYIAGFMMFLGAMHVHNSTLLTFICLVLGYFGLRCCGQNLLPVLSRAYSAVVCTDKQCAYVSGWHSLVQLGGSLLLAILSAYNAFSSWNYVIYGQIAVLLLYMIFVPSDLPQTNASQVSFVAVLRYIPRLPWPFLFGVLIAAFENFNATGMIFHLSDFARENGVSLSKIYKMFLPVTILTFLFTFVCAWVYSRISLKWNALMVMINMVLCVLCGINLNHDWCVLGLIVTSGLGWAFIHVLAYCLSKRLLPAEQQPMGYAAYGAITGTCSACGPIAFTSLFTIFGSYITSSIVMIAIMCALTLVVAYALWFLPSLKEFR